MDSSVSAKDEICFLRVCHHISNAVYWLRASAHERYFAAAVKQPRRPSISWLCARTAKETLRSQISSLSVSVCSMHFVESDAVCALLLRTRAKRRKRFWIHPLKSKATERAVPQIVWRLAYRSKKNSLDILEWLPAASTSFHLWLDPKLPTEILWWGHLCTRRKTGSNSKVRTLN